MIGQSDWTESISGLPGNFAASVVGVTAETSPTTGDWIMNLDTETLDWPKPELGSAMWIADRVSSLRKAKGLTISELGRQSGIDKGVISRTEDGSQDPTLGTLRKLAGFFGLTLAEFFSDPN